MAKIPKWKRVENEWKALEAKYSDHDFLWGSHYDERDRMIYYVTVLVPVERLPKGAHGIVCSAETRSRNPCEALLEPIREGLYRNVGER